MKLRITMAFLTLASALAAQARPDTWANPITQPALPNLHEISRTLYRSAQPLAGAQLALDELGIKTVVSLRRSADDPTLLPDAKRVHAPIESWDVDHVEVMRALRAILDPENQPVLLHCRHGADRTGTVIAAYRILVEDWTPEAAITEMREGGFRYHAVWTNMIRYLRKLDVTAARVELGLQHLGQARASRLPPLLSFSVKLQY